MSEDEHERIVDIPAAIRDVCGSLLAYRLLATTITIGMRDMTAQSQGALAKSRTLLAKKRPWGGIVER